MIQKKYIQMLPRISNNVMQKNRGDLPLKTLCELADKAVFAGIAVAASCCYAVSQVAL